MAQKIKGSPILGSYFWRPAPEANSKKSLHWNFKCWFSKCRAAAWLWYRHCNPSLGKKKQQVNGQKWKVRADCISESQSLMNTTSSKAKKVPVRDKNPPKCMAHYNWELRGACNEALSAGWGCTHLSAEGCALSQVQLLLILLSPFSHRCWSRKHHQIQKLFWLSRARGRRKSKWTGHFGGRKKAY